MGAIGLFFITVLIIALIRGKNPSLPRLEDKSETYKKILNPAAPLTFKNQKNKKYQGFRQYLIRKSKIKKPDTAASHKAGNPIPASKIRAAFYVPWAPQSFYSLEKNAGKVNMILPEWFFIDPQTLQLQTRIDTAALRIMRSRQLPIVPILTNFDSDEKEFNGNLLHKILGNRARRTALIKQIADTLQFYHFHGINIDFEELKEANNTALVQFQRELYHRLHPLQLITTIDVTVHNEDYDYKALATVNDYLFVMAYDEHHAQSVAGPISDQKWIEGAIDWASAFIPQDKMIIGIAAYGYDWPKGSEAKPVTYQEALGLAREHNSQIDYDNDTYNLHYAYSDDNQVIHDVWFTDAGTNFNTIRFAEEIGAAGVALWRLGSEDSRIWNFYSRDLSLQGLQEHPFNYGLLEKVKASNEVDYIGEGEILDVQSTPQAGHIRLEVDTAEQLISEQDYQVLPSAFVIKKFGEAEKKIVLTFDDGPDPRYTPKILDILEKEKVPGTFFVVGINAENNIPLLRRIYKDGYEIGNHTFTHRNIAEMSLQRADFEMKATRLLIECVTGRSTILFRAPYNADSEPRKYEELIPIARSKKENYYTVNEAIDPNDWEKGVSADTIFWRVVRIEDQKKGNIILLHDAGGNREATVEALPRIIHYFRQKGYQFITVAQLLGKTRDDVMPPLPKNRDLFTIKLNLIFVELTYWAGHVIFALFLVGIVLSLARILFMGVLAVVQHYKSRHEPIRPINPLQTPLVSVIIPAYNEEVNAVRTVRNLLKSDYPNLEIIFVDDGSTDATYEKVQKAFAGHPKVKLFTKENGGKASALNFGINISTAAYVVCVDADTQLKHDAVSHMMEMFVDEKIGAVAGNVKVGNEVNMLTQWQSIEYITSQNFDRRAFDLLNCITVVPGAIGAFRKSAIQQAGGFTSDTLAEDCDLTIRILREGYVVRNCTAAISYTEAPETLRMFLKQRFRWCFGVMQSFWKNRDACFNVRFKALGWVALPNILIYQILLPILAPLADLIMLAGILSGNAAQILHYYLLFMAVDAAAALLAFSFEKEKYVKLLWVIPQRLVYRQLMYYILFKSFRKAIKGELQNWGILKRTGHVQEVVA